MAKSPAPYGLTVVDACAGCLSRETSIFCGLPEETLRELSLIRQTALYPSKALLFVEDEPPRGVFVLCTGEARFSVCSGTGKRVTLRVVDPGEALGLSSVIANCPYQVTAETLVPSQACFFPRMEFLRFLHAHSEVSVRVAEHLSMELHKAWEQTRLFTLAPSAGAKLAQLLLICAQQHGQHTARGLRVTLNMTEEDIGEAIGTTRETVSRLLADFKRRGLISRRGSSLVIVNPDGVRTLSST